MFLKYKIKLKKMLKKYKYAVFMHYFFLQIDALTKNEAWLTKKER